jgi:aspartate/methionine/tyrosine aminotransferase
MTPEAHGVSARARTIRPFVVMDVVARAKELEAAGRDIVRLEIGDPDLPTPDVVVRAAEVAMEQGETGYTQSLGLPDLRDAVAAHYANRYGVAVDTANIVVTQGTSPAMLLLFGALLDPGDEVILPDPCYPAYPNYVSFLGGVPVHVGVRAEDGWRFRIHEVEAAVTDRTRAIMVNSPANPTGAVMPAGDLAELGRLADERGLWIASDEIYHGLQFDEAEHTVLEFTERSFVLNGFSKAYAMTGWRLGYLICHPDFVRACEKIQQNFFLCANAFVQSAGTVALTQAQGDVARMRGIYDERRRYLVPELQRIGLGVEAAPGGAFYVFCDARHWGRESLALAYQLLDEAGVAVAPGSDFGPGGEGFIRVSYAASLGRLREGVARLERWACEHGHL